MFRKIWKDLTFSYSQGPKVLICTQITQFTKTITPFIESQSGFTDPHLF